MRAQTFQRAAMTEAATEIGEPSLHPHELRHTAASLAIAAGADVKVVQQMLGHKSGVMTIDLSGHTSSVTGSTSWLMLSTPPFEPLACTRCVPEPKSMMSRDPRWARNWPLTRPDTE